MRCAAGYIVKERICPGYIRDESLGQNPRMLKSVRQTPALYEQMWNTIRSGRAWQGRVANRRKDGTFYEDEMRIARVRAHDQAGGYSEAGKRSTQVPGCDCGEFPPASSRLFAFGCSGLARLSSVVTIAPIGGHSRDIRKRLNPHPILTEHQPYVRSVLCPTSIM